MPMADFGHWRKAASMLARLSSDTATRGSLQAKLLLFATLRELPLAQIQELEKMMNSVDVSNSNLLSNWVDLKFNEVLIKEKLTQISEYVQYRDIFLDQIEAKELAGMTVDQLRTVTRAMFNRGEDIQTAIRQAAPGPDFVPGP